MYRQRRKLYNITTNKSNLVNDLESSTQNNNNKRSRVFMLESLTKTNGDLLKEAKEFAKGLNYKYPGYTVNGEVRVKLSDGSKHIAIRSKSDLDKFSNFLPNYLLSIYLTTVKITRHIYLSFIYIYK